MKKNRVVLGDANSSTVRVIIWSLRTTEDLVAPAPKSQTGSHLQFLPVETDLPTYYQPVCVCKLVRS